MVSSKDIDRIMLGLGTFLSSFQGQRNLMTRQDMLGKQFTDRERGMERRHGQSIAQRMEQLDEYKRQFEEEAPDRAALRGQRQAKAAGDAPVDPNTMAGFRKQTGLSGESGVRGFELSQGDLGQSIAQAEQRLKQMESDDDMFADKQAIADQRKLVIFYKGLQRVQAQGAQAPPAAGAQAGPPGGMGPPAPQGAQQGAAQAGQGMGGQASAPRVPSPNPQQADPHVRAQIHGQAAAAGMQGFNAAQGPLAQDYDHQSLAQVYRELYLLQNPQLSDDELAAAWIRLSKLGPLNVPTPYQTLATGAPAGQGAPQGPPAPQGAPQGMSVGFQQAVGIGR